MPEEQGEAALETRAGIYPTGTTALDVRDGYE